MTPAEIPRPQSQRVALYEQRFGKFDSGKNAYWSLRKERPVTLAEGARFDADMRAGRLAPVARGGVKVVRGVSTQPSTTGAGSYRVATGRMDLMPMPGGPPLRDRIALDPRIMGWWKNTQTGQIKSGRQGTPPTRMAGWAWSATQPYTGTMSLPEFRAPIAPQEITSVMPTEARYVASLPAAPPPGPARPPKEPLFEAVMRQLQELRAGPATETVAVRPAFAAPGRPFAAAAPAPVMAGFDMKKLALPLALVAGAFVVSKLV